MSLLEWKYEAVEWVVRLFKFHSLSAIHAKVSLAMKWLIGYARKRNEKSMSERLASEVVAAAKEEGATFKKKEDTHRMAEANKAFSHFRF